MSEPGPATRLQVVGLHHAAIKTDRLKETRRFFETVLGLMARPRPAFKFAGYWLYAEGRDVVHLVETDEAKAPSKAASINHFALRVADIEQAAASLASAGVAFEREDTPGGELRQLYLIDPNGVRIELNAPG